MKATRTVTFVAVAAALAASLAFSVGQAAAAAAPLVPTTLTKYVDSLPIPPVASPTGPGGYDLHMMQGTSIMHSQADVTAAGLPKLPPTTVWGYGDGLTSGYLGPTIEARTGQPFTVRWWNDLPTTHILASSIDYSLMGMQDANGNNLPESRAVTHLHGGHVSEASDGNADEWFLPGQSVLDEYPNDQQAATLWYHDHTLGTTRLNPYAGLAGFYIIRDQYEDSLNLPGGPNDPPPTSGFYNGQPYEVPLVIQDKTFAVDPAAKTSQFTYATTGILPAIHPQWVPEYFGDTILVNGSTWPFLNVEPRKYRFRLLNGSNARFYTLSLVPMKDQNKLKPLIYQIGGEGGLLPAVVPLQQLTIAPGERADVIIDFSKVAGMSVQLRNSAKAPYPAGVSPDPKTTGQIMQFNVGTTLSHPDTSVIPATLRSITKLTPTPGAPVRDVKMTEVLDPLTGFPMKLQLEDKGWLDRPATLTPKLGTTEIWQLINTTADTHPMHLHLVQFQVVSRQNFDVAKYLANGNVLAPTLLGTAKQPSPSESGWEDTIQVNPGEVVRIIATFDHLGMYPIHCHILEHEENDMMRPFQVLP